MAIADPEIRGKLEKLKERKAAYKQLLEGKAELGGAAQACINKIKRDLKKKSPETEAMEKSIADTETALGAEKTEFDSLTATTTATAKGLTDVDDFHTGKSTDFDKQIRKTVHLSLCLI